MPATYAQINIVFLAITSLLALGAAYYLYSKYAAQEQISRALDATYRIYEILLQSLEFDEMTQKIADIIPQNFGYETGVLALIDENDQLLKRVAISNTSGGKAALKILDIPFDKIDIPLSEEGNSCIRAINTGRQQITYDLYDLLRPVVSYENAKQVQKIMGTNSSIITPIMFDSKPIGVFIVSMSKKMESLTEYEKEVISRFSEGVGVAIRSSRLYTQVKEQGIALLEANQKLKEVDKAKDEFISITSHELKTPMTIIKSYAWMLQSEKAGKLNEKQKGYLDRAIKGTDRMIDLINDMLNISRVQQGRLELRCTIFDVRPIMNEIIEEYLPKIKEKGLDINVSFAEDLNTIYSDESKFSEIFLNLLSNAKKYTDEGSISVSAFNVNENFIRIEVKDTGRGISKEEMEVLFNKFQRLDNTYQTFAKEGGTGLGLYIIKLYVNALGAKNGVTSEGLGAGSTFWVEFPTKAFEIKQSTPQDLATEETPLAAFQK